MDNLSYRAPYLHDMSFKKKINFKLIKSLIIYGYGWLILNSNFVLTFTDFISNLYFKYIFNKLKENRFS